MTRSFYSVALAILPFFATGCCFCNPEPPVPEPEKPVFSFAVAGHVYGSPEEYTSSVYPPFLVQFRKDLDSLPYHLLFLTGDVVAHPTDTNWNTVTEELNEFGVDWYIARGNHDISTYIDSHVQPEKFLSLRHNASLFLVLNTTRPGWTVDPGQAQFIRRELDSLDGIDRVFVFTHQLWWERNTPGHMELDSLKPNSKTLYDGTSDFWTDIFPAFDSTGLETWFFAGDMGCHYTIPGYYEDHYENFHFYGSGMGGGVEDNYIRASIYKNGDVEIDRIDF